ncbi:gluconate 5-dehydrogenase [Ameyamaea chiangmaiensis NBRC 103196]|uniref:SDR family oxidoreductase n=1 Tax=Ameyamaea chiangmaiensis TaxID=442969 RepID=A0A850PCI2_9PROT|nr:SDR family oxidoreductase [Ameyamaea chiangmaiensis]MBS4076138.1 SDR family oxidoreductase [Ameyamaea chiangmaiensis]NVN39652.1 SDR family oxidoreductase [Ameyamaea chiangmaiensis]GBQ67162.1 gluconate 5-dehydrogenase [Ameyamaea chiangmaiensis NBRC 103196]
MQLFSLKGRIALVTGSSRGIGLALARALGEAGATLVLNGRDEGALGTARDTLSAEGFTTHTARFDVTDPDAVRTAVDGIERDVGPIAVLVNNAGLQRRAPLEDFPVADWKTIMSTNVDSVFLVAQAVARHMIARKAGRIINVCSVQSELARPNIAPYTASKGAVKMLTKGMATDWGKHNIQVNGLAPGYFKTELTDALVRDEAFSAWLANRTPAGRWGNVAELGGAAVFLASDAASFVNGHILYVDGGITASL